MEGSGLAPQISGRLWLVREALGSSGVGSGKFGAFLGSSGRLWMGGGRAYGALNAALERIWTALDGLDGFEIGLDGSGSLWAALGSFE